MRFLSGFGSVLIAAWLSFAFAAVAAGDRPSPFKITTNRQGDKVDVVVDASTALFSIRSPGGIGQAVIERTDARWPTKTTLRLHLNGLESLQASNGKTKLNVSVASHNVPSRIRVWKDSDETALLQPKDRWWIDVRMLDATAKPTDTIPLKHGYFELQLPPAFFEDDPKSITLSWIDFYRN